MHRIAAVNGFFDPTHGLSVVEPTANITVINIPRAGHCYDLNIPQNETDTVEVQRAREQELALIEEWIAEYKKI